MKYIALRIIEEEGFYAVPSNDNITRVKIARSLNHRLRYEHRERRKKNLAMTQKQRYQLALLVL